MSSIASPASPQPTLRRRLNMRAFLAGGTATAALIAAAVVVFGSLAAYVAFEGSPVRGADVPPTDRVTVGAPQAAAATLGRAGRVVAAKPAASTPIAPPPAPPTVAGASATAPGTAATATSGEAGTVSAPTDIAAPATGTAPTTATAPPAAATPTAPVDSTSTGGGGTSEGASSGGAVGGVVDQLDDATGGNLNLGETTPPVTGVVDETLNQVGGAVDNIGSQVTGAAGSVLGGG